MFRVELGGSAYDARLIATERLSGGQMIYRIADYRITHRPTYQTIQIGPETHIEELGVLAYLNHSCKPNAIVDTTALTVVAVRDIAPGHEITFFYPSTEWDMDRPFVCLCGAPECIRLVAGAKYLSLDTLSRHFINPHIREMALACLAGVDIGT
ncbi:MAG TPA: SET domain-containing protein-lysine N-methyltransferase [Anaerolineae bacterium]